MWKVIWSSQVLEFSHFTMWTVAGSDGLKFQKFKIWVFFSHRPFIQKILIHLYGGLMDYCYVPLVWFLKSQLWGTNLLALVIWTHRDGIFFWNIFRCMTLLQNVIHLGWRVSSLNVRIFHFGWEFHNHSILIVINYW